jgi:D-cysteine desulfhydrase
VSLEPALLRRYPALGSRLPWLPLGSWPTPVRRLVRLGEELGVELWLKDDGQSAPRYGGNKVRKLEPLLGAARAASARTLLTAGGIGSNHVLAVGVYARELGLRAAAVLVPQPVTPSVQRTLDGLQRLEVTLHPCPNRPLVPLYLELAAARARPPVFRIGPGGSSPLGTLGYVSAGLELAEQIERGELPCPETILLALGSGGSAAGLSLGLALAGIPSQVIGVRVVERWLCNLPLLRILIARTRRLLARHGVVTPDPRLEILEGELGERYGAVTPAGAAAVERALELEELRLETTYTGKALAGLIRLAAGRNRPLLFWNTYNAMDLDWLQSQPRAVPLPSAIARWLDPEAPAA